MAVYSGVMRTPFSMGNPDPMAELRASAVAEVSLLELGITMPNIIATNMSLALGRPDTPGGLVDGGWAPLISEEDPDAESQVAMAWAWAPNPTVPTAYFRRWANHSQPGAPFFLTFPLGLVIPPGGSLVLYRVTGSSVCAFDVHWVVEA